MASDSSLYPKYLSVTLEFFLNRTELSLNSANSGNLKITEALYGLNLKILSLHVSWWHSGSILVSHTRGGCVAVSSPFTVMTNIFVTEFSETFRKNSIDLFETVPKKFEVLGKTYPAE